MRYSRASHMTAGTRVAAYAIGLACRPFDTLNCGVGDCRDYYDGVDVGVMLRKRIAKKWGSRIVRDHKRVLAKMHDSFAVRCAVYVDRAMRRDYRTLWQMSLRALPSAHLRIMATHMG